MFPESMLGEKTQFEVIRCTKFPVETCIIFSYFHYRELYTSFPRSKKQFVLKQLLHSSKVSTECTNKIA